MGTWVAIEASATDERSMLHGVEQAFTAIASVDRLMHPERDNSDLARINRAAAGSAVRVDPWTFAALSICQQLHQLSEGLFDPAVPSGGGSIADLVLAAPCSVALNRPLHLDLGGIAKGFAVDRAIDALMTAGCLAGVVNAGGDLRVFGPKPQRVLIRGDQNRLHSIQLCNQALAVSNPEAADHPPEYLGCYARSNDPARISGAIAVAAASAALADGLGKPLRFLGGPQAARLLEKCGAGTVAWWSERCAVSYPGRVCPLPRTTYL